MSQYVPQPNPDATLHIYLGTRYGGGVAAPIGCPATTSSLSGFPTGTFSPSDVGNPVMVYGVLPNNLAVWTTITAYTSSTQVTVSGVLSAGTACPLVSRQIMVYREIVFSQSLPFTTPFVMDGSIQFNSSLTTRPTFNFTVFSGNGAFIPQVGQAVLVTQAGSDYTGDVFGGSIDQTVALNYPGTSAVQTQVQCVSWDQILTRRLLMLSGGFQVGTNQDSFEGYNSIATATVFAGGTSYQVGDLLAIVQAGASGGVFTVTSVSSGQVTGGVVSQPGTGYTTATGLTTTGGHGSGCDLSITVQGAGTFTLEAYPTSVLSITRDGVAQTFAPLGTSGVDWNWQLDSYTISLGSTGTRLGPSDTLVVSYDSVSGTSPSPSYANMTAGAIVEALAALLAAEGLTVSAATGALVDLITWTTEDTFDSALSALMTYINNGNNNYWYFVSPRLVLVFELQGSVTPAPFNISTLDGSDGNVLIQVQNTITREKYGNAAWVDVSDAQSTTTLPCEFFGDGSTTEFNTDYAIGDQAPTLVLWAPGQYPFGTPGTPQTVGNSNLLSSNTGFDWYWTPGSTELTQDDTALLSLTNLNTGIDNGGSSWTVGETFTIAGGTTTATGQVTSVSGGAVTGFNITSPGAGYGPRSSGVATTRTGGSGTGLTLNIGPMPTNAVLIGTYVPALSLSQSYVNQTAATARQAVEGGTGEYDLYLNISSTLPVIAGTNIAQNISEAYAALAQQVQVVSYRSGLYTGQGITLNLPEIGAVGTYVVDQVSMQVVDHMIQWTYELSAGAIIGDWKTAFKDLSGGGGGSIGGGFGGGGGSSTETPEVPSGAINGSNVTFTLSASPSPSTSLKLFRNGILQLQGTDYTLSGNVITMTAALLGPAGCPGSGADWLIAYYVH